jgi:pimeloyl-ACP methyl ester carboxylesterase
MGGGVALNMAHMAPDQIRSITMLSAVGVQELELLGNYYINHALYGFQLALIWFFDNGLPHMGLMDGFPFNLSYGRDLYDTDQRPLRQYLKQYKNPMLILHGGKDALVSMATAMEQFRLVPQSELKLYDRGHLMLFKLNRQLANDISDFIQRVETEKTRTRALADPERIVEAQKPFSEVEVTSASGY